MPGLDETARFTAQILRLNIREVGFYRELAAESPIRVPHCHFGAVDPEDTTSSCWCSRTSARTGP